MASRFFGYGATAIAALITNGCSDAPPPPLDAETTVFHNAQIITVDDTQPLSEAMAIRDGRILAVGTHANVKSAAGPDATSRNMAGKTIIPGFIDAHGHFSSTGTLMDLADLQPEPAGSVSSIADIQRILAGHIASNPNSTWAVGWGYDDSLLTEKRHPTRHDLDAVSADIPIFIFHVSGHLSVCNSKCLELASITSETVNPPGGIIRKNSTNGAPNGVLEETASELVQPLLPQPSPKDVFADLAAVQDYYARMVLRRFKTADYRHHLLLRFGPQTKKVFCIWILWGFCD